jgi:hypothetical protein
VKTLVLRNGKWRDLVDARKLGCSQWLIGRASMYRDPSF